MTAIAGRFGEFYSQTNVVGGVYSNVTAGATAALDNPLDAGVTALIGDLEVCGSLVDVSISGNVDELETTVHNDDSVTPGAGGSGPNHGTARTYIPNFHDETADISCRYNEADAFQINMLETSFNSLLVHFWYIPDGQDVAAAGGRVIWGDCFATSFSPSSPLDDTTSVDFSLRLSGTQYAVKSVAT